MFDKNQFFNVSFIVEQCTIDNGGCDESALCSNPSTVGGDVVCSCGAGRSLALMVKLAQASQTPTDIAQPPPAGRMKWSRERINVL